jgi:putative tryptophan/tyrosine transport system substrate-binding protein
MRRREFIRFVSAGAITWPLVARAEQAGKIYRVGLLTNGAVLGATDERRTTLLSALAANGFVDGQNLSADAHPERLDSLVAELKEANVDVIVSGYPAALAAKVSGKNVPIVVPCEAAHDSDLTVNLQYVVDGAGQTQTGYLGTQP